jgi:thiol-disulfide isomerase/thioredoxin
VLLLLLSILAACGAGRQESDLPLPSGRRITPAELPAGLGAGFPQVSAVADGAGAIVEGSPAPDFVLQWDDGRFLTLSDLAGKRVLLNFWATWCAPCRLEMPVIVAEAANDPNTVIIAVNVQEALAGVTSFAEEFDMALPVALDSQGALRNRFALPGLPSTFLIDETGVVVARAFGPLNDAGLAALLER